MSGTVWFLIGFIIGLVIVLIWVIYAFIYRTSVERLSRLAAKKFMMIAPATTKDQYVIHCNPKLSSLKDDTFNAVFQFTPDSAHPTAPPLKNITKLYKVTYDKKSFFRF